MNLFWIFYMVFSIIMTFLSSYESRRLLKKMGTLDSRTRAYVVISLVSFWGIMALISMDKAGYL